MYGLWAHGKRLYWFDNEQIESIKKGEFNFNEFSKNTVINSKDGRMDFEAYTFDAPAGWQNGINDVLSVLGHPVGGRTQ